MVEAYLQNVTKEAVGKFEIEELLYLHHWFRAVLDELKTCFQNHCILTYILGMRSLRKIFEFAKKFLHPSLFMKIWHVFEDGKDIYCQGNVISGVFHKTFYDILQIWYLSLILIEIFKISLVTFGKIQHNCWRFTCEAKLNESRKCKDAILSWSAKLRVLFQIVAK